MLKKFSLPPICVEMSMVYWLKEFKQMRWRGTWEYWFRTTIIYSSSVERSRRRRDIPRLVWNPLWHYISQRLPVYPTFQYNDDYIDTCRMWVSRISIHSCSIRGWIRTFVVHCMCMYFCAWYNCRYL